MKKSYIVISESKDFVIDKIEYFEVGRFDSYKRAKESLEYCIKVDKETENNFCKNYIEVEINLTKKLKIRWRK